MKRNLQIFIHAFAVTVIGLLLFAINVGVVFLGLFVTPWFFLLLFISIPTIIATIEVYTNQ